MNNALDIGLLIFALFCGAAALYQWLQKRDSERRNGELRHRLRRANRTIEYLVGLNYEYYLESKKEDWAEVVE